MKSYILLGFILFSIIVLCRWMDSFFDTPPIEVYDSTQIINNCVHLPKVFTGEIEVRQIGYKVNYKFENNKLIEVKVK